MLKTDTLLSNSNHAIRRVAYIMSRFPKITETFVLYEMCEAERQGMDVEVYPLRRESTRVMHPEAEAWVRRAHFTPWLSWGILISQLYYLTRSPRRYVLTMCNLVRHNWGSLRYLTGALLFFPKAAHFARQMSRTGVQHVHAHFASHPAAVAYVIHQLEQIPFSFTAHGSDLHRDQHMLAEKVQEAAFVATVSKYNRNVILDVCGADLADRVHVVHCGIDGSRFRPRQLETSESRRSPAAIGCIGTIHAVKGQKELIEAAARMRADGIDFELHFVGDGPELEQRRDQVREANLTDRTTFHGRLDQQQLAKLLNSLTIVAAPSVPTADGRKEGIPVAIMESLASEVAVVASRLTGIPELIQHGETGLLVEPGDVASLAEALKCLIQDSDLRRKLARQGRERVLAEFTLSGCVARLIELIRHSTEGTVLNRTARADTPSSVGAA